MLCQHLHGHKIKVLYERKKNIFYRTLQCNALFVRKLPTWSPEPTWGWQGRQGFGGHPPSCHLSPRTASLSSVALRPMTASGCVLETLCTALEMTLLTELWWNNPFNVPIESESGLNEINFFLKESNKSTLSALSSKIKVCAETKICSNKFTKNNHKF